MTSVVPFPTHGGGPEQLRPGQQLLPGYVVKLLKTLKIAHGTDRSLHGVDADPTVGLICHIVDCMGALRDINKVYRAKGSLASRSIGARGMFGFTAELGNLLLDAITFSPPAEFAESALHYSTVAAHILSVFPEIAAQVTKDTGKMLIHHTALKASPIMALESLKMVLAAHPGGASAQDNSGALPLHWITHNPVSNFELVTLLIAAYPKATLVPDVDGYLPLHWAVNQDSPNPDVVAALLSSNTSAASKPCNKGSLPLHWCVNREAPSLTITQALLQVYPDAVRTFNDEGWLPIHRCVDRSKVHIDVLKMLIALYPQGLQCPNADGQLPIHRALDHPNPSEEAISLMIQAYPGSLQVADDEGYLPLHLALDCAAPSVPVVKLLLKSYPDAAHRKSKDGLLPLHCIISSIFPPLELVQALLELFPESPEHAAIDIVPVNEDVDPDSWQGEWVKKRWTPLSRAIGRRLDGVVTLMKASLQSKRVGLGAPLKTVDSATTKRLFPQNQPPVHGAVDPVVEAVGSREVKTGPGATGGDVSDRRYPSERKLPSGRGEDDEDDYFDEKMREGDRDRDRGRDKGRKSRHHHKDRGHSTDRDGDLSDRERERRGHRSKDRSRDRRHRSRGAKDGDYDTDDDGADRSARGKDRGRDRETDRDRGGSKGVAQPLDEFDDTALYAASAPPAVVRGNAPTEAPPSAMASAPVLDQSLSTASVLGRPTTRRGPDSVADAKKSPSMSVAGMGNGSTVSNPADYAIPLRDLDLSDDDDSRMVGRSKVQGGRRISGEDMV